LGDSETGYVLTEGNDKNKLCVLREGFRATLQPCNDTNLRYTPLQLQFASESDIKAMASPAARLMGAASDGDKKLVAQLIKEGISVNIRDWDQLTALIPASSSGHLEVVKFLVKEGADVNAADKDGITPLMEASIMGHPKIVEFLLSSGATVDESAKSGVTALWLASGEGKTDIMSMLLAKGADPGNVRGDGITALMSAAVGGRCDAIQLLLENGADPKITDADGLTPLMSAAENGTVACIEHLVAKADKEYIDSFSKTGFSALIIAAAHGNTDAVKALIKAGADVNSMNESNQVTALMYAAASGHIEVLKVLLENGVNLHAIHSNGGTALLEASTGGQPEAMQLLLEAGAKVNFIDFDGVTPLMAIASQGNIKGVKLIVEKLKEELPEDQLIDHINLASYSGGTALMFAAAGGHLESMEYLIQLGGKVNDIARATPQYLEKLKKQIEEGTIENDDGPHIDGVTAVHVAALGGHLECVKRLIAAGADVTIEDDEKRTPLQLAIKGNYGQVSMELVRAGANPDIVYVDEDGETHNLLMDALVVENVEFAKVLIANNADLGYKDAQNVGTLLQASHRGMTEIVKLLLEKHGDKPGYLDDASTEGITPLIAASSEGHIDIVQLLVDTKRINVNAKDKDGTTALMAACARGYYKVVEILVQAGAPLNEQNDDGHTALMFAYNGKNQVETLWERFTQYVGEEEKDSTTGPMIQEALANHTSLLAFLLKSGADRSIKDKEGHTAKDFDFHPDADADVLAKEAKAERVRDTSKNEL
jgi:ankyrin repeat protein